ncbi:oocyte-expressed protein homolog [Nannospalax galili]|uniref:oocyte-expressed protein homolog n=1 Tax=Nannospalax galili TaxID=1026970 RepID=UPI00111C0927|nr:oocyte-expressed protein homolog [Nannospalax galili]
MDGRGSAAAAAAAPDQPRPPRATAPQRLLSAPSAAPRLCVRPWWFPARDLSEPLLLYLETWLVDAIFGPDRMVIPEMEWLSQALLRVDTVDTGNLAEITIFGRPREQNRVKNILLNLASWHKEHRVQRAKKMEQLEEFLKVHSSIQPLLAPVEKGVLVRSTVRVSSASAPGVEKEQVF